MNLVVPPILCFALVAVALRLLLESGLAARIALDLPNERSLHAAAIPRIGGIVLVTVGLLGAVLVAPALAPLLAIAGALALLSAWDDRHGLPVALRFAAHLLAAAVAAMLLLPDTSPWGVAALALVLAWGMNLYNFMDGSDGLAGGMAVIGFGALGLAALDGAPGLAAACLCLAGAAAGFLLHNFHPARVFLGDAGSIPLGFLAGGLGLAGWAQGLWPAWFPVLVFSPFIVDASLTLASRVLRGERPWQAHREHAYQRMVAGGIGHRRTALLWYALMAVCAVTAVIALRLSTNVQWTILTIWGIVYAILATLTARRFPLRPRS